jgi:dihydroorotate dehydrogenase (fumarate)
MKSLSINPPLLNSANPWCTTLDQLRELYGSPHTGAVTTRTSLLNGFPHNESIHQFAFYNPTSHNATPPNQEQPQNTDQTGSLNTLGYSPLPLKTYLAFIKTVSDSLPKPTRSEEARDRSDTDLKPFIISVTGTVEEVTQSYRLICTHQPTVRMPLAMEVNLSCPNIPNKPPPAYSSTELLSYLLALKREVGRQREANMHVPIGIKTPPYTYQDQYTHLITALLTSVSEEPIHLPCPISFVTATNTLGSSLLLSPTTSPTSLDESTPHKSFHHTLTSLTGPGIGGLAGAPLHPLALGNVYTIKQMLVQHKVLEGIQIIGVGGVEDGDGYWRMRAVGADAVAVGTALGRKGIGVFEGIGEVIREKE